MNEYEFELYYQLPAAETEPDAWLDALFRNGCDDALVGLAVAGQISLAFARHAPDAVTAVRSAIRDVEKAVPGARRISAGPDLLNLSELAELTSTRLTPVTRQAMRKYASGEVRRVLSSFPPARVAGTTPLWQADDVLVWMRDNGKVSEAEASQVEALIELLKVIRAVNVAGDYAQSRSRYPDLADKVDDLPHVADPR